MESCLRTLRVKTMDAQEYSLSLPLSAQVAQLKQELAKVAQVPVERQRLVYMGKMLKDEESLESLFPEDNLTLHLMARTAPSQDNPLGNLAGQATLLMQSLNDTGELTNVRNSL